MWSLSFESRKGGETGCLVTLRVYRQRSHTYSTAQKTPGRQMPGAARHMPAAYTKLLAPYMEAQANAQTRAQATWNSPHRSPGRYTLADWWTQRLWHLTTRPLDSPTRKWHSARNNVVTDVSMLIGAFAKHLMSPYCAGS